ncbi:MAG: hypothetical protein K9G65_02365 [Rickettsiaceae bacterium]|nr:hypothetical protein [Rickettsiaceae bacterium]
MKTKYTEHSLIEKYKNLTSLIEYYKSLNLGDSEETNILYVGNLEKFVRKTMYTKVYDRSSCCEKLLKLGEELQELVSRKDFDIDYVNDIIWKEEEALVKTIGSGDDNSYHCFDCVMM